jgi:cyanophycin synthetase
MRQGSKRKGSCARSEACGSSAKQPIEAFAVADSKLGDPPGVSAVDPAIASADIAAPAADATAIAAGRDPNYLFADSRRLTGPNRYFDAPAVTLTPLGPASSDPRALDGWAERVRALSRELGWPDPQPLIEHRATGTFLVFRAPADALLTATELSEWAWERAAAENAPTESTLVSGGSTKSPRLPLELAHDFGDHPAAILRARAAAEQLETLATLRRAAHAHGLPLFEDDEEISVGAGAGSLRWLRCAPPAVEEVPWSALHNVPTALITGSNGKTTTVRLVAAMAAAAGRTPGYCCTEGVFVAGRAIALGDYSGPAGARAVLRDRSVTLAVLETARGGILRRGLAVERADVALVTNVRADHFGEYGIETTEDLAETKLVVARAVCRGGTLVLNADDGTLMSVARRLPHAAAARHALFAFDYAHPALVALRARGGSTCAVRDQALVLTHADVEHSLGKIVELPLTLGGTARHGVFNLLAATLVGALLGLPLTSIARTVTRFGSDPGDNPGRLERWRYRGAVVLIDYAHNPDGLEQLLRAARSFEPARLTLLLGQAGNRDDGAIAELASTAARFAPDRIVIKELSGMLRGRETGEVPALLRRALLDAGVAPDQIYFEPDEESAARILLDAAEPGDVIVLPVHTREVRERLHATLDPGVGGGGEGTAPNGDSNHILEH